MSDTFTDEDPCPNCGRRTLTERGITVKYNDGSRGGATWLDCINCEWDAKSTSED